MSPKKKLMYICIHCTKVVDTKDQKRHSRNCTVKESPGLYEEPDVLSSSDDENEVKNAVRSPARATQAQKDDETSRIINAVHNRQPLWDTRMNKLERSMKIQAELWTEVDEELGFETGKARTLWALIRHRFHGERRKVEAGETTSWQYYTPLLFLVATRQKRQQSQAVTPKHSTSRHSVPKRTTPREVAQKAASPKVASPKITSPKVTVPKIFETKKKKAETQRASNVASNSASNNQPVIKETHQFFSSPNKRGRSSRSNIEPLYALPPPPGSMNESRKRDASVSSSDSDVDVVEEINMNGSLMRSPFENPISYKRVCIRQLQETQVQNLDDDDEDDEIRRFCSYLEVMLRKLPKENQEMFCEETLDHLASVNRKLRRSNL